MDLDSFNFEHQMDMELSKNSFPYFFQNVLGWDFASHQQEWLELMNDTQRTVIICSRGHGKSVFMHSWVVWNLIFREPPYQMLYISSNQKQTLVHMRDIDKLFNHPMLKKYKPAKGWAIGNITLTNGNQILERSVGSQIRGLHPQEIIIDDPMKEFSVAAIQRVTDWFWGDMIPTLHHTATLRMVGTPFTYTDIFAALEENPEYDVQRYPAINETGDALWPSRWDIDSLEKRRREIGSSKFTREYLCIPISSNTMLFGKEFIDKSKDRTSKLSYHGNTEAFKYYIGYDPSLSADGDYTVMMVIEVDEDMNKKVVWMVREKNMDFRSHITRITDLCERYKPEVVMIETNTFAKSFAMELRDISDFPVKEFTMHRKKKEEIILNLQMNLENNKIILPYADEKAKGVSDAIIQELEAFGISSTGKIEGLGAHDDIVIALALANHATKSFNDAFIDIDSSGLFGTPKQDFGGGIYGINM